MEQIYGLDKNKLIQPVSVAAYSGAGAGELAIKRIIDDAKIANKSQQDTFGTIAVQTVNLYTVSANDYAELTCLSGFHVSAGTITFCTLQVVEGANTIYLNGVAALAVGAVFAFNGSLLVKPGGILRVTYQVTAISPVCITSAAFTLHPAQ